MKMTQLSLGPLQPTPPMWHSTLLRSCISFQPTTPCLKSGLPTEPTSPLGLWRQASLSWEQLLHTLRVSQTGNSSFGQMKLNTMVSLPYIGTEEWPLSRMDFSPSPWRQRRPYPCKDRQQCKSYVWSHFGWGLGGSRTMGWCWNVYLFPLVCELYEGS